MDGRKEGWMDERLPFYTCNDQLLMVENRSSVHSTHSFQYFDFEVEVTSTDICLKLTHTDSLPVSLVTKLCFTIWSKVVLLFFKKRNLGCRQSSKCFKKYWTIRCRKEMVLLHLWLGKLELKNEDTSHFWGVSLWFFFEGVVGHRDLMLFVQDLGTWLTVLVLSRQC